MVSAAMVAKSGNRVSTISSVCNEQFRQFLQKLKPAAKVVMGAGGAPADDKKMSVKESMHEVMCISSRSRDPLNECR